MHEKYSTFERLVQTIESSERQNMLRQLAEASEVQADESRIPASKGGLRPGQTETLPAKLSDEPFLVRLWFRIRSLFSSLSPDGLYADYLVSELGKRLARSCSGFIDIRKRTYSEAVCGELEKLKNAQDFFSSLLSGYDAGKGDFYVILASLLVKDTYDAVRAASDLFSVPYDRDPRKDVRAFYLHEMETVLQSMPEADRARMYQSAQAIEWLKRFCELPLGRMVAKFDTDGGNGRICLVDSISEDLKAVVNLFAGAKRIPVLLLEALFLFTRQDDLQDGKFDMERECQQFVLTATGHLTGIRMLKASVPLADFVRFSARNVKWQPTFADGGEDWFVAFRAAWKERFEERWTEWNRLHRKAMLVHKICALLEVGEIPPLPYHPWDDMWLTLSLRRELSITFLKEFFRNLYPKKIMKPLKILLIEGEFYRRENLAEYTDAFSVLDHQQQTIEMFENRLSPKGDIGDGFALILHETMATVQGKARLENLMLSTDSEAEAIIGRVMAAFSSIDRILEGVLDVVRGGPYETLVNMALIQGKFNEQYRKDLGMVRALLKDAASIVSEAEVIEKETLCPR